jgi:hypothetical protein
VDVKETKCEVAEWIQLPQDRGQSQASVNTIKKPSGYTKGKGIS